MQHFGQKIRTIREQKDIGLNQMAARLNVSSGYLSNLERGKTEKIFLWLIPKLESELKLSLAELIDSETVSVADGEEFNEFNYRVKRCIDQLMGLQSTDPDLAGYLLTLVEQGLELEQKRAVH